LAISKRGQDGNGFVGDGLHRAEGVGEYGAVGA
jgi:hypothetical protein